MKVIEKKQTTDSKMKAPHAASKTKQLEALPYPFPSTFSKSFSEQINKRFLEKTK